MDVQEGQEIVQRNIISDNREIKWNEFEGEGSDLFWDDWFSQANRTQTLYALSPCLTMSYELMRAYGLLVF